MPRMVPLARRGRIVQPRVRQGERGVPFGGEGGVARAALDVSRTVDAELARGEARVAGAAEGGEKPFVLERLAAVEAAGHEVALANEILHFKGYSAGKSINLSRCDCSNNVTLRRNIRALPANPGLSGARAMLGIRRAGGSVRRSEPRFRGLTS
jgi:hypothetical protein